MHFTREQRDAWYAEVRDSPFNVWLRERTTGVKGKLDLTLLRSVAAEFGVDADCYAHLNPGQQRMNVGNRLRKVVSKSFYDAGSRVVSDPTSEPALPTRRVRDDTLHPDFAEYEKWPVLKLLQMQGAAVEALRRRGIVRTGNAPLGDYAEYLFARAFGWELTRNSTTSHDPVEPGGLRFQIKARRLRDQSPGERQLGILRNLPDQKFDKLAAVLFDHQFQVWRAALIPHAVVLKRASHIQHVNGWRFMLEDSVWRIDGVLDVTTQLKLAAEPI